MDANTSTAETTESLFGEVIYAYTRAQALEDGELVAVPADTAGEAGFRWPVAITRAAWSTYVEVPPRVIGQDEAGRLWDVLWMLRHGMRLAKPGQREVFFRLHVRNDNRNRTAPLVTLKAVSGPADDGSPCLTIMLPEES